MKTPKNENLLSTFTNKIKITITDKIKTYVLECSPSFQGLSAEEEFVIEIVVGALMHVHKERIATIVMQRW
jgi:hypothetical protein